MLPGGADSANGAFVGLRVPIVMGAGGCKLANTPGVYVGLYPDTGKINLATDMCKSPSKGYGFHTLHDIKAD